MRLEQDEYVWAVTFTSRDDGHRCTAAYFSDRGEADLFCRERVFGDDQTVVQTTLWKDAAGTFFQVRYTPVKVDENVHRREALKKLSVAEKRALGLM